jgi:hypothetical protein
LPSRGWGEPREAEALLLPGASHELILSPDQPRLPVKEGRGREEGGRKGEAADYPQSCAAGHSPDWSRSSPCLELGLGDNRLHHDLPISRGSLPGLPEGLAGRGSCGQGRALLQRFIFCSCRESTTSIQTMKLYMFQAAAVYSVLQVGPARPRAVLAARSPARTLGVFSLRFFPLS